MVPSGRFQGECLWCQEHVPHKDPLNIPEAALIKRKPKAQGNETGGKVGNSRSVPRKVYD